jgi:hypothetical protein
LACDPALGPISFADRPRSEAVEGTGVADSVELLPTWLQVSSLNILHIHSSHVQPKGITATHSESLFGRRDEVADHHSWATSWSRDSLFAWFQRSACPSFQYFRSCLSSLVLFHGMTGRVDAGLKDVDLAGKLQLVVGQGYLISRPSGSPR